METETLVPAKNRKITVKSNNWFVIKVCINLKRHCLTFRMFIFKEPLTKIYNRMRCIMRDLLTLWGFHSDTKMVYCTANNLGHPRTQLACYINLCEGAHVYLSTRASQIHMLVDGL